MYHCKPTLNHSPEGFPCLFVIPGSRTVFPELKGANQVREDMGAHTGSHIIRALLPKLRNSARVWCDSLGVTGNLSGSFRRTELPQQESARIAQDRADSGYHWLTPGGELATCISTILKTGSFGALLCDLGGKSIFPRLCWKVTVQCTSRLS